jgi:hypothetical protein
MNIFDLLFIALFFATVITLFAAIVTAIRGHGVRALRVLKGLGVCLGIYFAIVVLTSYSCHVVF